MGNRAVITMFEKHAEEIANYIESEYFKEA